MTFYYTASHFEEEIAKKEKELQELKMLKEHAEIREFYWHINSRLREMDEAFYNSEWVISFDGKTVTLPNCAEVFQGIEQVLFDYMEVENIEYEGETK